MVTDSMEVCEMDDVPKYGDAAAPDEHRSPPIRTWTSDELDDLDNAPLIRIAVARPDGTVSRSVPIGHVRVGGHEIVRSLNGTSGVWYRGATSAGQGEIDFGGGRVKVCFVRDVGREAEVDEAFRLRYGDDSGVRRMTSAPAREATLRVLPVS